MKLLLTSFFIALFVTISPNSHAKQDGFYVVAAAGYAANDINDYEYEEVSFKLNVGYVFNYQWSMELGFNGLGDSNVSNDDINNGVSNYDIKAVRLSALGRASNQYGELFYRVGVMQVQTERTYATDIALCDNGDSRVGGGIADSICFNDDEQIAGVIGLGYDFNMTDFTQLRVEIEHIQGQDDYTAQALLIGLRVNF